MHLICPQCSREVTGKDVNIAAAVARCPNCYAVFSFNASQVVGQAVVTLPRPQSPKPSHLNVDDSGRDLKVWWNWLHWGLLPMAGFCLFWNGFLIVWYSIVIWQLFDPQANGQEGLWIMAVFPVLHVAVGVTLGYATACGFLNTTSLEVAGGELTVRHGPLPCFGNLDLETRSITQLYCVPSSGQSYGGNYHQPPGSTYDLVAQLVDNTKATVLAGQTDPAIVWYLEQLLEKHLKIEDARVAGEYVG